jgi:dTDP-4-amino-4,6-dideoxygalactose transaminase
MNIPFLSLKKQYQQHKAEIDSAVIRVLESGWYILGKECDEFEAIFKRYLSGDDEGYVIGVNSGTDALRLSLIAAGIGDGDEVITVANTAIPTISAICSVGAKPVFCDVDDKTWLMDPNLIEELITANTKAIIPVHLYGFCADMDKISDITKSHDLVMIEDAAQATGALYGNRKAGTIGDYGAFSFYPTKNLGACGDGGAIFVKDRDKYEKLRKLRNYGQSSKYFADTENGINSRLDEIQAAILKTNIKYIDEWNDSKARIAKKYIDMINSFNMPVKYQIGYENIQPAYHLFVIRILKGNRDDLIAKLKENGIETMIHYPIPIYDQISFSKYKKCDLEVTETLTHNILSIPMNPHITETEIEYIAKILMKSLNVSNGDKNAYDWHKAHSNKVK